MGESLLMNRRKIEDGPNEYDKSQKDQESSTKSPDRQAAYERHRFDGQNY